MLNDHVERYLALRRALGYKGEIAASRTRALFDWRHRRRHAEISQLLAAARRPP